MNLNRLFSSSEILSLSIPDSQKRNLGHPIFIGWSDTGHPPSGNLRFADLTPETSQDRRLVTLLVEAGAHHFLLRHVQEPVQFWLRAVAERLPAHSCRRLRRHCPVNDGHRKSRLIRP